MCTFVHVIYVLFGDNKGNKKGWNPSEGFSLISFRAKNFYRTAIIKNMLSNGDALKWQLDFVEFVPVDIVFNDTYQEDWM